MNILNKSLKRRFTLQNGKNGEKRVLLPQGVIEALDEKEVELLLGIGRNRLPRFAELVDADKVSPLAAKAKGLSEENAKLIKENAELKAAIEKQAEKAVKK